MEFNWINAFGGGVMALMLAPNVVYALRCPGQKNKCRNPWVNALEQVGRYAAMALMVFPLGVWEFGFDGVGRMLLYLAGNGALLLCYWLFWFLYFRKPTRGRALTLAVVPMGIFLLSGLTLGHRLLTAAALLFGVGHVYVTLQNAPEPD